MNKKILLLAFILTASIINAENRNVKEQLKKKEELILENVEKKVSDKEILFFSSIKYHEGKNKKVRNVKFLTSGQPEGPTTTVPGIDIIKPGQPGGPTTTVPGIDIIKPGQPGGPTTTVPGIDIIKPGQPGGPTTTVPTPIIWEEGKEILEKTYQTNKNLTSTENIPALKGIENANITNNHIITVNKSQSSSNTSKGIYLTTDSKGENNGTITVIGENSIGVEISNSTFENKNKITVINKDEKGIHDSNAIGINVTSGSKSINTGEIHITGKNSIGVEISNSTFENKNKITVTGENNRLDFQDFEAIGINVTSGSRGINTGEIHITGKNVTGIKVDKSANFINEGIIQIDSKDIIESPDINARAFNIGGIEASVLNKGQINLKGNNTIGLSIFSGGTFLNTGSINITGNNNIGAYVADVLTSGTYYNKGDINITGNNNTGVIISKNGKFINEGNIIIDPNSTGNREFVNNGGTILNKGLIKSNEIFKIDSNGVFELGKNGVIEAKEVIGNIKLNNDLTFNNYSDVISEEILKTENYKGNITSDSFLYNIKTEKTENGYLVNLERKEFTEILENKGFGDYLENNYTNGSTSKDKLFNELKLSKNEKSLNEKVNNVFGNSLLPNLKKQTLDLINNTKDTLIKNVFKSKATKEIRTIAGYDYKKNEVKSSENLSGYDETINSIYLGMDKEITQNLRAGGVLTLTQLKSNYQNAYRKDSNLQANIFAQYNKNDLNYVFNGFIGGTNGDLKRKLQLENINSNLSTNLENRYIGFNNIVSKKIEKNGFVLEPQFQVNATYLKINGVNEKGEFGIKTSKEDVKSFEVGTGITIEKNYVKNKYVITPKLGANYFYEFGSPYKAFEGQILDISTDKFEISKNSIDRGKTELLVGVDVEKGNLKMYGDYKFSVEREENLLSAGFIFKFN